MTVCRAFSWTWGVHDAGRRCAAAVLRLARAWMCAARLCGEVRARQILCTLAFRDECVNGSRDQNGRTRSKESWLVGCNDQ